jgi:hypothetical protein
MRMRPTAVAIGAAMLLSIGFALPAKADLVFKMSNQSKVEAKGVGQSVGIVWLKRGQTEDVRAKGNWTVKSCFAGTCPAQLASSYVVNFENLGNAAQQYCVWNVKRTIQEGSGENWGTVYLEVKLTQSDPNFICETGGQTTAKYHSSAQGLGATLNFTLKSK